MCVAISLPSDTQSRRNCFASEFMANCSVFHVNAPRIWALLLLLPFSSSSASDCGVGPAKCVNKLRSHTSSSISPRRVLHPLSRSRLEEERRGEETKTHMFIHSLQSVHNTESMQIRRSSTTIRTKRAGTSWAGPMYYSLRRCRKRRHFFFFFSSSRRWRFSGETLIHRVLR